MSQIRPRQLFPLAALKFGAATSTRVNCGRISAGRLNNLPAGPCTFLALVYPTSLVTLAGIMVKTDHATLYNRFLQLSGTAGNLVVNLYHATTAMNYVTTDAPLAKLNNWYWVASNIDTTRGVGERARIYAGPLNGTLTRQAVTATEPVGAIGDDTARNFVIGNRLDGPGISFPGSIALAVAWNRELSFAELARLTRGGGSGLRESNPVGLWRPGLNTNGGTVVHDESGNANHGTITGAVQSGVRVVL